MTDLKDTNKEAPELTEKERAIAWMNYVSDEVNALLALFLPISKEGVVGVKYKPVVVARYESGPQYDTSKTEGVEVRLVFNFEEEMPMPSDDDN